MKVFEGYGKVEVTVTEFAVTVKLNGETVLVLSNEQITRLTASELLKEEG